jgi:hypothetical protein
MQRIIDQFCEIDAAQEFVLNAAQATDCLIAVDRFGYELRS